jgi:hypothetical protein
MVVGKKYSKNAIECLFVVKARIKVNLFAKNIRDARGED